MEKNKIPVDSVTYLLDAKYQLNGLTYASNISTVNKRDEAGNLQYNHDDTDLLVIEPIAEKIINSSVIKVVDTQFNYFKFPATTTVVTEDSFDLGIDPNDFIISVNELVKPTPSVPAEYAPAADQQVAKSGELIPLDFSVVVTGPPQSEPDAFVVTQEVLDLNSDLTISGVITTYYNSNNNSQVLFNIMNYKNDGTWSPISSYPFYPTGDNVNNNNRVTKKGTYVTNFSAVIAADDLVLGEYYKIGGAAEDQSENRNHTVQANNSYVQIDVA
jgi:hypothetical protein